MPFLTNGFSQGVQGMDNNGGFGTAAMFNKPTPQQQGNFGGFGDKISALVAMLRNGGDNNMSSNDMPMPESNAMPQMTPMQQPMMGANMGQVNNPNMMSPNGQIMPNYNRTYGGFNGSNQ